MVDRVWRGGTDDQKRNPSHLHLKRGVGVGGTRQGGVAGINKVSCKFHVTLFGCQVGGDVGQLGTGIWMGRQCINNKQRGMVIVGEQDLNLQRI